jgi:hypothetical protein
MNGNITNAILRPTPNFALRLGTVKTIMGKDIATQFLLELFN